ncbi:MAG TPA: hypothetical protein VF194_12075 [Ferrovibrio sp.]|jgi:hypothetical protein|uniref:hypothetical protein n=1 Tax=Ferrovibrio sp. TaxID=1917215 RepID=UPI002ED62C5C
MAGFHTTALTRRCIAKDETRQALLRLAEDLPGNPDRIALLFDFSGIPEIKNRLFFRSMIHYLEDCAGAKPLTVTPVAMNCVVLIADSDAARAILAQMKKFATFLRYQRHGTFEVSCFDLRRGHRQFAEVLRRLMEQRPPPAPDRTLCFKEAAPPSMEALDSMITVGRIFGHADISVLLRNQDIWFFPPDAAPVTIGREFWLSMSAVESLLNIPLLRDSWLFDRTTQFADHRVLMHMLHMSRPFPLPHSINLHLATIFTGDFRRFATALRGSRPQRAARRHDLIVELPAQECVLYPEAFAAAVDILEEQEICVALDRLLWQDLPQVPEAIAGRASYIKIAWSSMADNMARIADSSDAEGMIALIERFGSDKIVLTRCDHPDAVERGLRLGVRRFQGRGINRFLFSVDAVERVLGQIAATSVAKSLTRQRAPRRREHQPLESCV